MTTGCDGFDKEEAAIVSLISKTCKDMFQKPMSVFKKDSINDILHQVFNVQVWFVLFSRLILSHIIQASVLRKRNIDLILDPNHARSSFCAFFLTSRVACSDSRSLTTIKQRLQT